MASVKRERRGIVRENIELEVRVEIFTDDGGNDRLRAEAYLVGNNAAISIGGVDIIPNPPSPMFSMIQHRTPFTKKGVELSISTTFAGSVGSIIGDILEEKYNDRYNVRRRIEAEIDTIAEAAFKSALEQAGKIRETE